MHVTTSPIILNAGWSTGSGNNNLYLCTTRKYSKLRVESLGWTSAPRRLQWLWEDHGSAVCSYRRPELQMQTQTRNTKMIYCGLRYILAISWSAMGRPNRPLYCREQREAKLSWQQDKACPERNKPGLRRQRQLMIIGRGG